VETITDPDKPEFTGVFSKEFLSNIFVNNEEGAKSLLAVFLERTTEQMEGMPDLIVNRDWDEMYHVAHMIRGSVMMLSGMELGEAAGRIENAYKQNNPEKMVAAFPVVAEAFQRFKAAAKEYIHA